MALTRIFHFHEITGSPLNRTHEIFAQTCHNSVRKKSCWTPLFAHSTSTQRAVRFNWNFCSVCLIMLWDGPNFPLCLFWKVRRLGTHRQKSPLFCGILFRMEIFRKPSTVEVRRTNFAQAKIRTWTHYFCVSPKAFTVVSREPRRVIVLPNAGAGATFATRCKDAPHRRELWLACSGAGFLFCSIRAFKNVHCNRRFRKHSTGSGRWVRLNCVGAWSLVRR